MGWLGLALLAAVAKAANHAATRPLTRRFDALSLAALGHVAFALCTLALLPRGIDVPGTLAFHRAAWITIALNVAATVLLVQAIADSDLSRALPFLALTPLLTVGSAWLLRGERASALGIVAVIAIVAGALAVDARDWRDWRRLGGRRVLADPGVRRVLVVAAIYAVTSVFDKTATLRSDPVTFVVYGAWGRLLLFALAAGVFRATGIWRPSLRSTRASWLVVSLIGATFALEAWAQMESLRTGPVAYVIAVKRCSILLTSLAGFLWFRERFTLPRLAGALAMVAGAALLGWA